MPKQSYRSKAIRGLLERYERAKAFFIVDQLLDSDDDASLDFDSPAFLSYLNARSNHSRSVESRYLADRVQRKSPAKIFKDDLRVKEDGTHWLNDDEFKRKYRMSREMHVS